MGKTAGETTTFQHIMLKSILFLSFLVCLSFAEDEVEITQPDIDAINEKNEGKGIKIEKATKIESVDDVIVLTDDNFDDIVEANEFVLVEFYAPWCGHCKKLEPEYAEAAKIIKDRNFPCKLAKVDATEQKITAGKFDVKGYPTLKFFKSGKPMKYDGPRDAHGIVMWIEKHTGPPVLKIELPQTVEEMKSRHSIIVFGCFNEAGIEKFEKVAEEFLDSDVKFLATNTEEVMKTYECELGTIMMLKDFDDPKLVYEGVNKKEDVTKWILEKSVPLVWEFDQNTGAKIFASKIKVHFLYFINEAESAEAKKAIAPLKDVAAVHKDDIIFVTVNAAVASNKGVLDFFGLGDLDLPTYGIYEMEGNAKYMAEKNTKYDRNAVMAFIKKFLNKELPKSLKSAEISPDWDKEPVKILVGKNFNDVAMDKSKHVFVEFYAPWCGHCKSLAPIWDDLGKKFEDNKDIVIAKMDSTANEVADVAISGFPTLKLFKKDTNEILEYSGARELDNLVKFIEELSDEKVIDDEEVDDSEDGKIPEADDKSKHEEL